MKDLRYLVDASNIHTGGALQVAISLVNNFLDLADTEADNHQWLGYSTHLVSPEVAEGLPPSRLGQVRISSPRGKLPRMALAHKADAVLKVFGPDYTLRRPAISIAGYADVTAVLPTQPPAKVKKRITQNVRAMLSRALIRRHDLVVVESPHFRGELLTRTRMEETRVAVIPNALNEQFIPHISQIQARDHGPIRVAFIARHYPHKNHRIIGDIGTVAKQLGWDLRFITTLTEYELRKLDPVSRSFIDNAGVKSIQQLPALISSCDISILPSLLESSSATPIESLSCAVPTIVSDLHFMRAVLGDAVHYVDPDDASSWAQLIIRLSTDQVARTEAQRRGLNYVSEMPTAKQRAIHFSNAFQRVVQNSHRG